MTLRSGLLLILVASGASCSAPSRTHPDTTARVASTIATSSVQPVQGCSASGSLTGATISRTASMPGSGRHVRQLHVEATRANAITVYSSACRLLALPEFHGATSCPADFGVFYHLTFLAGAKTLMKMTLDASGCRTLASGSGPTHTAQGTYVGKPGGHSVNLVYYSYHRPKLTQAFVSALATAAHIPSSQVFV